jgi:DNA-binding NtrC family response regulator
MGVLEELVQDLGFRSKSCTSLDELTEVARNNDVGAIVAAVWTLEPQLPAAVLAQISTLARLGPVILLVDGSWVRDSSAADLGVLSMLQQPFDLAELEQQLRRCLTV